MQHHTKPFIMAVCAGSSVPARSGVEPPGAFGRFWGNKAASVRSDFSLSI